MSRSRKAGSPPRAFRLFGPFFIPRFFIPLIVCAAVIGCLHLPRPWQGSTPWFTVTGEHAIAALDGDQYVTSWSPDGTQLALMRNLDGAWNVWTMRIDGTHLQQLTHGSLRDDAAAWSPDGRRLVFTSDRINRLWPDLWLIDPEQPEAPERLTPGNGKHFFPAWSPDGAHIAFEFLPTGPPFKELRILRVADRAVQVLSTDEILRSQLAWRPDGKALAFLSNRTGNPEIWIAELPPFTPGLTPPPFALHQLTHDAGVDRDPSWSPDGRFIAFTSDRSGNEDIWVVEAPDLSAASAPRPEPQQLTRHPANDHYPRWSPDGRRLAFTSNRSGREEPWLMTLSPTRR
ncbi:MAG: TolB family protein [Nitrospirae bacterium]|nr:TolB family protein [Nitrospirota bacterium]